MGASIRRRVLLALTLVVCVPLAIVWGAGPFEALRGAQMRENTRAAVAAVGRGEPVEDVARRRGVWLRVVRDDGRLAAEADHEADDSLWTRMGDVFFGPAGAPALHAWDEHQPPLTERRVVQAARSHGSGETCGRDRHGRLQVCSAALRVDGGVALAVESSRRAVRALHDVRYQVLKLTLFVLLGAALLGLWLGFDIVRPIRSLHRQVVARSAGGREPIRLSRGDELGALAAAFDRLLGALEARDRAKEAFVADMVHELKNPIAAVRAAAEVLRGEVTAERAERVAGLLEDGARRMEHVVGGLLELAHAEAGLSGERRVDVDLRALARALVARLRRDPRCGEVSFEVTGPAIHVEGAPGALETALGNLLENAAASGKHVEVQLRAERGVAEVTVADDGPPIDGAVEARLFERFFTTRAGGTGLGLAMARAVAEAHGGGLTYSRAPKSFTLRLRTISGRPVGPAGPTAARDGGTRS